MKWDLLALDRATGKVVWQKTLHQGKPAIKRHTKATHANATAATDGQRLAVMLGEPSLATPAISEGRLYFRTQGSLIAVGAAGGATRAAAPVARPAN